MLVGLRPAALRTRPSPWPTGRARRSRRRWRSSCPRRRCSGPTARLPDAPRQVDQQEPSLHPVDAVVVRGLLLGRPVEKSTAAPARRYPGGSTGGCGARSAARSRPPWPRCRRPRWAPRRADGPRRTVRGRENRSRSAGVQLLRNPGPGVARATDQRKHEHHSARHYAPQCRSHFRCPPQNAVRARSPPWGRFNAT